MQRKYYPYTIKNKRLFGKDIFTKYQRNLRFYMEELSEKYFYAGWRINLEYFLWYELSHPTYLNDSERKQLRKLSKKANSWMCFDGVIKLKTWIRDFRKNKRTWYNDWIEILEANEERL